MKRFNGWEPQEVHEEFDGYGTLSGRTVVTREPEWDDEQRQIVLEHFADERMTSRCGHHPATGMNPNLMRMVEHASCECFDCTAIRTARTSWHKENQHSGEVEACRICADEVFWVDEHRPIG